MGMLAMLDDKSKGTEISDRHSASAKKLAMAQNGHSLGKNPRG
jgi:hypothetical protein